MLRCLLAAAILLCAQPVWCADDLFDQARAAVKAEHLADAERLLRLHLQLQNRDEEARFLLARVLAWRGQYGEALDEYDKLLAASPANSDYLFGKAQVLVWNNKPGDALPLLEHARQQSPEYEEVWRLQLAALRATGDTKKADELKQLATARFPASRWGDVDSGASASPATFPAAVAMKRSELELGFSSEGLNNGYAGWRSAYLEGRHSFGERKSIYGTLRETERFGLYDNEAQGGFYYPLNDTWTSLVEASVSPTHNVLPKFSVFGELQKHLGYGWNLHAGIRHNEYSTLNTNIGIFTAERYWGNFRGAYSLYLGRPEGGSSASSHVLALDYYYGARNSVGISVADGREVAGLGPLGILTTEVRAYVLRGRHWFTPDWALSFEALYQEQGTLYNRQGIRLGLRRVF